MRLIPDPVFVRRDRTACAKPLCEHRHGRWVKHHVVLAQSHAPNGVTAAVARLRFPRERYRKHLHIATLRMNSGRSGTTLANDTEGRIFTSSRARLRPRVSTTASVWHESAISPGVLRGVSSPDMGFKWRTPSSKSQGFRFREC